MGVFAGVLNPITAEIEDWGDAMTHYGCSLLSREVIDDRHFEMEDYQGRGALKATNRQAWRYI